MFVISLLLIPRPLCAVAVVLSIVSVNAGVLGMMKWCGVNLDVSSMITLAVSVGFSVDFAAHITYAYITANNNDNERIMWVPFVLLVIICDLIFHFSRKCFPDFIR